MEGVLFVIDLADLEIPIYSVDDFRANSDPLDRTQQARNLCAKRREIAAYARGVGDLLDAATFPSICVRLLLESICRAYG